MNFNIRSRAAKKLDKIYRTRDYVPACPHCKKGITAEQVRKGLATINKHYLEICE